MSRAWLLPEQIADVLPSQARRIEELRRSLIDGARRYGFELVMPPLLEHLESLLSGTGHALDLKTFKLVDQLSGRTLGLRADTTPQVARIDAHLLNRQGVARLCYCGPVLHTRADNAQSTREPLQFGAEIYGHGGLEADLEIIDLALDGLHAAGVDDVLLDLGDARIVRAVLGGARADEAVIDALARKDEAALTELARPLPAGVQQGLAALLRLYGGPGVLDAARAALAARPLVPALSTIWPGWPTMCKLRTLLCASASTWPTSAAMPTTAARASRSMVLRPTRRWHAGDATTKSAPCSAATGRRLVSASMRRHWCRPLRSTRRWLRSARPGARALPCAQRCGACASRARWSSVRCPAMNMKRRNTTATAS